MEKTKSKREAIINGAIKKFCKEGFHKVKVEEIAMEAKVGKGTIYEYFDSKRHLFEEMIRYLMEKYLRDLERECGKETDVIEKLRKYIKLQKKYFRYVQGFSSEIHKSETRIRDILFEARKRKIKLIERIINIGIEDNVFKKVNSHAAALTFIGGVKQIQIDEFIGDLRNESEVSIEDFLDIFLSGIQKK